MSAVGGAIAGLGSRAVGGIVSRLAGSKKKSEQSASQPAVAVEPLVAQVEPATAPERDEANTMPEPKPGDEINDYRLAVEQHDLPPRDRVDFQNWIRSLASIEGTDQERRRAITESWRQFSNYHGPNATYEQIMGDVAEAIIYYRYTPDQTRWLLGRMGLTPEEVTENTNRVYQGVQAVTYTTHEEGQISLSANRQARIWEDDSEYLTWLVSYEATQGNTVTPLQLRTDNAVLRAFRMIKGFDSQSSRLAPGFLVAEIAGEMLRAGLEPDDQTLASITNPADSVAISAAYSKLAAEARAADSGAARTVEPAAGGGEPLGTESTPEERDSLINREMRILYRDGTDTGILEQLSAQSQTLMDQSGNPQEVQAARAWFEGPFLDLLAAEGDVGNNQRVTALLGIAEAMDLKRQISTRAARGLRIFQDEFGQPDSA